MKLVDLGEPTSFLDHSYLGCTPNDATETRIIADEYEKRSKKHGLRKNNSVVPRHGRTWARMR